MRLESVRGWRMVRAGQICQVGRVKSHAFLQSFTEQLLCAARGSKSFPLPAIVFALISCGGRSSETTQDQAQLGELPQAGADDCGRLMVGEGPVECRGRKGCERAIVQRERRVEWIVSLDAFEVDAAGTQRELTELEQAGRVACVVEELKERGISAHELMTGTIIWESTYVDVEDVLGITMIDSVTASCASDQCGQCEGLTEQECIDAFCSPIMGAELDEGLGCVSARGYAGCGRGAVMCGQLMTTATDDDGSCWLFVSTCVPMDFSTSSSTDEGCAYADFMDLPMCGAR